SLETETETETEMMRSWRISVASLCMLASLPTCSFGRHILLDKIFSDNPPPGQSDASCAHLVRVGLDEGIDAKGNNIVEPEVHHLISAMRKSWWECAAAVANALAKYGSEVEDAFQMEQRSITKSLNEIKSALQKGKPMQSISPAFEWAQSGDWVYINAKMSHKLDAPATLNVVSEGVKMNERSLKFAASKDHKRFSLDLTLHADIEPDTSTVSFGSVGRVTFTLKKAKNGVKWPKLVDDDQKKPVNMHVWWAKQEEYSDELDDLEEAAAEASEKEAKAEKDGGGGGGGGGDVSDVGKGGAAGAADPDSAKKAAVEPEIADATMSPQRRLASEKKKASMALAKEKKSRYKMEELEKEKRAVTKSIDANAASKKKEADKGEEYLDRTKFWILKAAVAEEFEVLIKEKHAEVEAAHEASQRAEL
ncbi:unnamed protein product, partial [Pylaiella littoralis]